MTDTKSATASSPTLLGIALVVLILASRKGLKSRIGGWCVVIGGLLAWLSHLLLDTFYNHGKGVAIFWPVSDARMVLPVPWLSVVIDVLPSLIWDTVRIMLIELATFGPMLVLVILIRRSILTER